MIRDIILNLERDKSRDAVCSYAISIAETFESHLAGVAFADGSGIAGFMMPEFPAVMIEEILMERQAAASDAVERFEAAAKRSRLSSEHQLITLNELGAPDAFSTLARRFDLSVIMQSDDNRGVDNDIFVEAALFESGRPVIVVPYIQKDGLKLDRIVCCWDGSRAAARSINDALPLLKKARAVELFIVAEKAGDTNDVVGVEMASHLARHDIKVEVETVPASDVGVADVILSHAADCSASMIVMGGYGHSRLREFILGGVTRGILSTMTVPVFISH